MLQTFFSNKF